LESPAIYLISQQAYQDQLGTLPTFLARRFQSAERVKVLPFLHALQERRALTFPILVEGLDYLLFHAAPNEREDVMRQVKSLLSAGLSRYPNPYLFFLVRDYELSEREIPHTVVLRQRGGGEEILLYPIFPSDRRETMTSASGKTYFKFSSLGS
jgi:hypothetical protein